MPPPNRRTASTSPAATLVHQPFAVLGHHDASTVGAGKREAVVPVFAVVRRERKGRGGKDVTVVDLALADEALSRAWFKEAKAALGCGGAWQDGTWILQGDQRDRVRVWLQGRGVCRVTLGG